MVINHGMVGYWNEDTFTFTDAQSGIEFTKHGEYFTISGSRVKFYLRIYKDGEWYRAEVMAIDLPIRKTRG